LSDGLYTGKLLELKSLSVVEISCRVNSLRSICDSIVKWSSKYNNRPQIWITERDKIISEFRKEGDKKGRIRIIEASQKAIPESGTRVIEIISPSEYGNNE
jgi:hypothetical protein